MEVFYKLAYDISCYYAFVAFFLSYGMDYNLSPYSFPVFFIACILAVYSEKMLRFSGAVRMVAFVLPIIPVFLETGFLGKLFAIFPWIYLVVTVLREGYDISYYRFRKTYLVVFWIYTAVFVFFMAESFLKGEVAMLAASPFILLLLVSGSLLLQILRFQSESRDKKKLEKHQRKQLLGFMVGAVVLTVGNVIELLYMYVFYPLTKLLLEVGTAIAVFLVDKLDNPPKPPKELGDNGKSVQEFAEELQEIRDNTETIWGKLPEKVRQLPSREMDYMPIIIAFVILGAIVILTVMIGSRKKKRKLAAIEDEREEYFEEVPVQQVIKKRSVHPELVIRFYYREFMKKSETKKHRLETSDTTADILEKYTTWNNATTEQSSAAQEATLLYQKTRYSKAKITKSDAGRMKALVKGL